MPETLRIEINGLPEETAKVILMAASNWNCTPDEAALRLIDEAVAIRTKPTA